VKERKIERSIAAFLRDALGWKETDAKPAVVNATLLFLIVAAFVVLKTIRDTSFLISYHVGALPQYMALNTLASALVAFLILRLYKILSLRHLFQIGLLVFATGTILLWEGFPFHISIKPKIFYLWVGIYGTIIPVQAWALVSTQLSSRQVKRTLGWVASGAILGGIAGGLLSRILVKQFGLQSLYPCSVLLMILAFAFCPAASGSLTETTPPVTKPLDKKKIATRYLMFLIIIVAIGTIVSTFLDFQFKAYTQREYRSETALGSFLGTFYALIGVSTLAIQLFITPFILKRIGLTAGLAAMPFLLFLGSGILYLRKSFSAVVMLRGSEELLTHSVNRSSFEVLQLAMPAYQKIKLKSLVDTIGIRVSELIGCLILIVLFTSKELPLTTLTIFNVILTFLWFVFALMLGIYEYPKRLKDQLRREELDLEVVRENLFSNDFHRTLPVLLRNAPKDTILRILELLDASDKNWLGRYLTSIDTTDPEVRLKTLQLLFLQKQDMTNKVKLLLSDPDPKVRTEAIHYVLTRDRPLKQLKESLNQDEDLSVRAALCATGLKVGSKETQNEIENILKIAITDKNEFALQEIAHVLQFVAASEFSIQIYKRLLSTPSIEVRKSALRSIGSTKPQSLIPILLKLTRVPALKADVRATLARFEQTLVPFLEEIILNHNESTPRRKLALKFAADVGGVSILDSVLEVAQDRDISLRFSAIKTLNYFRKSELLSADHPALFPLLEREIYTLESEQKLTAHFASEPKRLIYTLLSQRIVWTTQRIFRMLGLIFPADDMYHVYLAWSSTDERKRDAGLELLEHTLPAELNSRLLPLLETSQPLTVDLEKSRADAFQILLDDKDPLLIAAAALDMDEKEWNRWSDQIRKLQAEEPHTLLKETIQRRSPQMDTNENKEMTIIEKMEHLSKIDLFSNLSSPELLLISEIATEAEFDIGTILYKEGDPSEEIISLVRGRVELVRNDEPAGWIEAGESVGTLEILTSKNRVSTAIVRDTALCLRITGETFWEILEDYTPVCHGVISVLAEKIETLIKDPNEPKR
jgi:AAA family ATP:ADP antiporter